MFKEGGAFEFYNTYTALLDRLQAMQGDSVPEHLEDLPLYSTDGVVAAPSVGPASEVMHDGPVPAKPEDVPDEMPPAYDDVADDDGERGRSPAYDDVAAEGGRGRSRTRY